MQQRKVIQRQNKGADLNLARAGEAMDEFFAFNDYSGRRILVIVPDHTRSGPVGEVFGMMFNRLQDKVAALDVLVALGTHQRMTEEAICRRLCIPAQRRGTRYAKMRLFNHEWDKPETYRTIGRITADEIHEISGGLFRQQVEVRVNKLLFDYDDFFILGPVFPHEVVGFSGGHKYIFPGIAGSEIINFFHWLGAVITNPKVNGTKWTPMRRIVEKAASFIEVPRKLFAIVAAEGSLKGIFIGDVVEAWETAADLSDKVHIAYKDHPYNTILGIAPKMYDDLWVGGKVMYKLEPIAADGGTIIIYAPHITEISYTHGRIIDEIGYHTRDYFRKQWDKFKHYPWGVIAHSTHVRGIGTYTGGVEKPRVNVVLATGIPPERCRRVNLAYMDPDSIDIASYENREDQGVLVVHHAGEILHRLRDGTVPSIPQD